MPTLSPISLAQNIDVSLTDVMRMDSFPDRLLHRWTVPETTLAQVIAGRYEIEHAGGHLFIEPGEMYIVQANTTIAITHHFGGCGRMEAQWVRFSAMLYRTCDVVGLFETPLKIVGSPAQAISGLINELWSLSHQEGIESTAEIPHYLVDAYRVPMLLMQIVEAIIGVSHPRPDALALLDHANRLAPVLEFVHRNLTATIRVEDLAGVACLSPSHFHAAFRQAFGQTPIHYIRSLRIREACRLLLNTPKKIQDVAEETGFGNAYYFCRAFKAQMGVSPKHYRTADSLLRYSG